jgi:hypothetical protein
MGWRYAVVQSRIGGAKALHIAQDGRADHDGNSPVGETHHVGELSYFSERVLLRSDCTRQDTVLDEASHHERDSVIIQGKEKMMMDRFGRRIVAATVLVGVMTMSTACYGPFNLTKNVYHWNGNVKGSGQVNDKWMKEIVFFGMLIIPAYMFSALLDTFIFNSMHFWTGESPIKASDMGSDGTKVTTLGDTTIRWTPSEGGATVTYERHGIVERRATIVASSRGYRLVDEDGNLLSEAEYSADGAVRLLNRDRQVLQQWSEEQLYAIAQGRSAHVQ